MELCIMAGRKIKEGTLVEVEWLDAAFMLDLDEKTLATWIKEGGSRAHIVGYVLHHDSKGIVLPCESFEDGTKRGITYIPSGMIKRIRKVKK